AIFQPFGNFNEWKAALNVEKIQKAISIRIGGNIDLSLPRFEIESQMDGMDVLQKLNINGIFQGNGDLSGISNDGPLSVSSIQHRAKIEVIELGTEAKGDTTITVSLGNEPTQVTIDRP
ncbi:hypothetical protein PENTCL1PPCAC_9491, partial [Pristionchus entomophagus]